MAASHHPVIRPLQPDEAEAFRELRLRALREAPDAFGTQYEVMVRLTPEQWAGRNRPSPDRPGRMFVAGEPGALVGCSRSSLDPDRPSFGDVTSMWVNPEQRGVGIGAALLIVCEQWARDHGRTEMALAVTEANGAARRVYERAGYRGTGEMEALRPGSPLSVERMEKSLL